MYWNNIHLPYQWDIMEPITFFTGLGTSILGYTWWLTTKKNFSEKSIYEYFREKRKLKEYSLFLDKRRIEELEKRKEKLNLKLNLLDDECFYLSALKR